MPHVDHVLTVHQTVEPVHLPQNVLFVLAHINLWQPKIVLSNVHLVNTFQTPLPPHQQQIPPQMQQES